jgi:hypothetical protein
LAPQLLNLATFPASLLRCFAARCIDVLKFEARGQARQARGMEGFDLMNVSPRA